MGTLASVPPGPPQPGHPPENLGVPMEGHIPPKRCPHTLGGHIPLGGGKARVGGGQGRADRGSPGAEEGWTSPHLPGGPPKFLKAKPRAGPVPVSVAGAHAGVWHRCPQPRPHSGGAHGSLGVRGESWRWVDRVGGSGPMGQPCPCAAVTPHLCQARASLFKMMGGVVVSSLGGGCFGVAPLPVTPQRWGN